MQQTKILIAIIILLSQNLYKFLFAKSKKILNFFAILSIINIINIL